MQLCDNLGIPLASEKIEGLSISLSFLGICLDTARMEIRLPNDKLSRIRLTPRTVASREESHQMGKLIIGGPTSVRHKGGEMRMTFHSQNVCHCSKSSRTTLLHETKQGVQVGPGLVACICPTLEWP